MVQNNGKGNELSSIFLFLHSFFSLPFPSLLLFPCCSAHVECEGTDHKCKILMEKKSTLMSYFQIFLFSFFSSFFFFCLFSSSFLFFFSCLVFLVSSLLFSLFLFSISSPPLLLLRELFVSCSSLVFLFSYSPLLSDFHPSPSFPSFFACFLLFL